VRFIKRNKLFYFLRFWLQSGNQPDESRLSCFNDYNKVEDVPMLFREVFAKMELPQSGDFERALAIARAQRKMVKGGRALGFDSEKTLRMMLDDQGGVCSDQAQAYNVFCLLADIKVREWGTIESASTPDVGHVINEIYSRELEKWIAIDVMKNLWFADADGNPMSITELFRSRRRGAELKYVHFSDHRCIDMYKIERTYAAGCIPFYIDNYRNKTYDRHLIKFNGWPAAAVHGMLILTRQNYRYRFVLDDYKQLFFGLGKKSR
jgi:hypothetical protein